MYLINQFAELSLLSSHSYLIDSSVVCCVMLCVWLAVPREREMVVRISNFFFRCLIFDNCRWNSEDKETFHPFHWAEAREGKITVDNFIIGLVSDSGKREKKSILIWRDCSLLSTQQRQVCSHSRLCRMFWAVAAYKNDINNSVLRYVVCRPT